MEHGLQTTAIYWEEPSTAQRDKRPPPLKAKFLSSLGQTSASNSLCTVAIKIPKDYDHNGYNKYSYNYRPAIATFQIQSLIFRNCSRNPFRSNCMQVSLPRSQSAIQIVAPPWQ
eukprot:2757360-Amphidinium_carterae.1